MNDILKRKVFDRFKSEFKTDPLLIFSPGRINLIGEHTDYNLGFVFPAAIDKGIYLAIGFSSKLSKVISLDMDSSIEFSSKEKLLPLSDGGWKNYLLGVVEFIKNGDKLPSEFNMIFGGDIPIGSGLSSSAALENGIGYALNECFGLGKTKLELLKISQKAEHDFVGVRCGIMDQFASMMGEKDQAILLDCSNLESTLFPVALEGYSIVLLNSNVDHNLAGSEYNKRREECEEGVAILQKYFPSVKTLRDVTMEMLEQHKMKFTPVVLNRCEYILEENERVQQFGTMLSKNEPVSIGEILYQGHEGMKNKYEITCKELDFLVDYTKSFPDVLGARMMGGGFGGCTLNIVKVDFVDEFVNSISTSYNHQWGLNLTPISVEISDGVGLI